MSKSSLKRSFGGAAQDNPPSKKIKQQNGQSQAKKEVTVTDINVASFVEHRSVEIQAMAELVQGPLGNSLAFQKLPRHMRRRAMSHNIKRIPSRLRNPGTKLEVERAKAPGKRPSRRHRRRPSNLLSEYERRKRRIGWLETHIWHAKRFKMVEKWGYRLAFHPNDKSIRACYRAVKRHCLLQDVSFEATIELRGSRQAILDGLAHLTSCEAGLTFAAKMTADGTRQGQLVLYESDSYPHKAIGPITYLWRAQTQGQGDNSDALWVSCHPSIYAYVFDAVNKCFGLTSDSHVTGSSDKGTEDIDETNLKSSSGVTMTSLKDSLVRFRLLGPASNLVLSETLAVTDVSPSKPDAEGQSVWWKDVYSRDVRKQEFKQQSELWSKLSQCQSPSEAPPRCVVALTVRDPRLMLPPKRNKVSLTNKATVCKSLPVEQFTPESSTSPLWEPWVRENVKVTKISEQKLNLMKSKHFVPGTPLQLGDMESRIPVILIQQPGANNSSLPHTNVAYGSGWDLILPSGFAMAFWVALVYRGARVGGIREARSVDLQAGLLSAPRDYPDTPSGALELCDDAAARQAKHDRMPPAKRPNHVKLGFPAPFKYDYSKLVGEWQEKWDSSCGEVKKRIDTDKSITVVRNRKILRMLGAAVNNPNSFLKTCSKGKKLVDLKNVTIVESLLTTETGKKLLNEMDHTLVPVRLSIPQRGVPASHARVYMPSSNDLQALDGDKSYGGPTEPRHKDPGVAARKEERKERLRLRRKKRRGKGKKVAEGLKIQESLLTVENKPGEVKETEQGMDRDVSGGNDQSSLKTSSETKESSELKRTMTSSFPLSTDVEEHKPPTEDKTDDGAPLLGSNSRDVIGYVSKGDFDLVTGQGLGFGFCSVAALLRLLEHQKERKTCLVLVRNVTSFQYRFATLSLVY